MSFRSAAVWFPAITLEPGEEDIVRADDIRTPFRPSKLVISATMKEIRGHFRLKRSRLPPLDRDDVVNAHTRVYRCRRGKKIWFRRGRTTVEYRGGWVATDRWGDQIERRLKAFIRTYLPSSVLYIATDASEYIELRKLSCDNKETTMPSGVSAQFFGPATLGNAIPLPTTEQRISIAFKNVGDVVVRVQASLFGVALEPESGAIEAAKGAMTDGQFEEFNAKVQAKLGEHFEALREEFCLGTSGAPTLEQRVKGMETAVATAYVALEHLAEAVAAIRRTDSATLGRAYSQASEKAEEERAKEK